MFWRHFTNRWLLFARKAQVLLYCFVACTTLPSETSQLSGEIHILLEKPLNCHLIINEPQNSNSMICLYPSHCNQQTPSLEMSALFIFRDRFYTHSELFECVKCQRFSVDEGGRRVSWQVAAWSDATASEVIKQMPHKQTHLWPLSFCAFASANLTCQVSHKPVTSLCLF